MKKLAVFLRDEWSLAFGLTVSAGFLLGGSSFADRLTALPGLALLFVGLFLVALACCLSVVRHADHLAQQLGEPFGTLTLTLAVTLIEVVSISAVTVHGADNPALVRDTIFAVIMILLNGMVGLSLLLGGWRHREQAFNLLSANNYLGVIIPLAVLSLILPNYTRTTPGPTLSALQELSLTLASVGLYGVFLGVQTIRHRTYFTDGQAEPSDDHEPPKGRKRHKRTHAILLAANMVPLVFLAEQLASPVDRLLAMLSAPAALGGVVIALLVATPEALSAIQAAAANRLQRSMNIFLGSVLSTTGLTIPAMICLSLITGRKMVLGLTPANAVLLVLTLAVSLVTFSSGRTNVLQGAIHLVLFGTYLLLIFQG